MSILNQGLKSPATRQGDSLPSMLKHVTQRDINLYAEASGDFNPIHIDEAFAKQTPLGGTVAHGMLVLAYASEIMMAAFGESWFSTGRLSVRFKAPARPNDTLTVSGKVNSVEQEGDTSYVRCIIEVRNQNGEAVVTGEAGVKL